ncbi:hypothetical protein [Pedobacter sp. P26]|uniref:hypothetical protein n=1 Tax=Pedobacter sp. P26 TaxID=3423956 RepID=UPI003D676A66
MLFKKSAVTLFVVASSARALAPFSQYSPTGDRSSSGSGQAQLGQSKPLNWFMFSRARLPLKNVFSSIRFPIAAITACIPAADCATVLSLRSSSWYGFSAEGFFHYFPWLSN